MQLLESGKCPLNTYAIYEKGTMCVFWRINIGYFYKSIRSATNQGSKLT